MLFRETVAVNCKNHTEHINTLCEQNAELLYIKACDMCSNHCAPKGEVWFWICSYLFMVYFTMMLLALSM
jgi:hypothetical protein